MSLTHYDTVSGNMWADVSSSSQVQTRYLNNAATDQLIARIGATGLTAWYLTDDQGSVGDLMDNTGTIQDHITYDAFGNILSESNPIYGDRIKYDGREFDSVLGLYYNRARMYDATTGRWMSQDPLGFSAGDSNLYRYVGNAPTNATDPSGEDTVGIVGDDVVWRVPVPDQRSTLRKFWDGMIGANQNPERTYRIGKLSSKGGYLNSVDLSETYGGGKVALADIQQAARSVDLGGLRADRQSQAIQEKIARVVGGAYQTPTPTLDRALGNVSTLYQTGLNAARGMAETSSPMLQNGSVLIAAATGVPRGSEADAVLFCFTSNWNVSPVGIC